MSERTAGHTAGNAARVVAQIVRSQGKERDVFGAAAQGDDVLPVRYRRLSLDTAALQAVLAPAPRTSDVTAAAAPAVLALPMPQGGFQHFGVENSPVMDPLLAAQFPDVQTYRGRGIDDPAATLRLGLMAQGFHAIILSMQDTVYITREGNADNHF